MIYNTIQCVFCFIEKLIPRILLAIASKITYNMGERMVICVANTTAVYARIDTGLKNDAERILPQLGISPSSAIQMLYSQIILCKGMPFDLRLPESKPVAAGSLSRNEIDAELMKGIASLNNNKGLTVAEVDVELKKEFGI